MLWFMFVTLALVGAVLVGHWIGWGQGVKDTERRWSDAVNRGHDRYDGDDAA